MTAPRWLGAILVVILIAHAVLTKMPGKLAEMLWCCHVATLVMAIGLATRQSGLVAAGLIFHVAVGIPAYVIDAFQIGGTAPSSVLVHLLPSAFGVYALRREDLSWWTAALAWGLYAALLPICLLATPAALNINLSHRTFAEVALPGPLRIWTVNLGITAAFIAAAAIVLRRVVPSRAGHV